MAIKLGSGRDRKPPSGHAGNRIGILAVVGGLFAFLVILCCGGGVLLNLLEPSPRIASDIIAAAPSNEPDDTPLPEQNTAELLLPDHSPPPDLTPPPIEDLAAVAPAPDQADEKTKPETESSPSKSVFLPRTWTTLVAAHTVLAELVQFNETHVQLKREDTGKLLSIPLEKLSAIDNAYVEQIRGSPTVHHDGATLLVGKVTRILDGDTVKFRELGGDEIAVRLDGVDASERDQRFGDDATRWLAHQVAALKVGNSGLFNLVALGQYPPNEAAEFLSSRFKTDTARWWFSVLFAGDGLLRDPAVSFAALADGVGLAGKGNSQQDPPGLIDYFGDRPLTFAGIGRAMEQVDSWG